MIKQSEFQIVCTNQNCRYRPFIDNWDQLLPHIREGHNIVPKDQFLIELQHIYEDRYQQQDKLIQRLSQPFEFEIDEWFDMRVRELKQIREVLIGQIENQIGEFIRNDINEANSYYEFYFKSLQYQNVESQVIDNLLPIYHQKEIYQFEKFNKYCNELLTQFLSTLNSLQNTIKNQHDSNLNYIDKYFNKQSQPKSYTHTFNEPKLIQNSPLAPQTKPLSMEQNQINSQPITQTINQQPQSTFSKQDSLQFKEQFSKVDISKSQNNLQETQNNNPLKGYKTQQNSQIQGEEQIMSDQARNAVVQKLDQKIETFKKLFKLQEPKELITNQKQNNLQETQNNSNSLKGYKNQQQSNCNQQIEIQKQEQQKKVAEQKVTTKPKQKISPPITKFSDYSLELKFHIQSKKLTRGALGYYSSDKPQTIFLMPILQRFDNATIKIDFKRDKPNHSLHIGILDIDNFDVAMLQQPNYPNLTLINQNGKIFRDGETDDKNYQLTKPVGEIKMILKNNAFSFSTQKDSLCLKHPMKKQNNYRIFIYFDNVTFKYIFE